MKKIISIFIVVIIIITINSLFAQLNLNNGDFQAFIFTGDDCYYNPVYNDTDELAPFQSCSTQNYSSWWVSHGTPEVYRNGAPAYQKGLLWSGNWDSQGGIWGEGIFLYCQWFEIGKIYDISFKISSGSQSIDNIYIDLATGLPNQPVIDYNNVTTSGYYDIPVPSTSMNILHLTNFYSYNLVSYNIQFIPDDDYDQLWIHPVDNDSPIAIMYVDDFEIHSCENFAEYENTSNLPGMKSLANYIWYKGNVTVNQSQNIIHTAGNYIKFTPPFTANSGCSYKAYISECGIDNLTCANYNTKTFNKSIDILSDEELKLPKIVVFPNPFTNSIYLDVPGCEASDYLVEIYNAQGNKLYNEIISGSRNEINTSRFASGIYIIKLSNNTISFSDIILKN